MKTFPFRNVAEGESDEKGAHPGCATQCLKCVACCESWEYSTVHIPHNISQRYSTTQYILGIFHRKHTTQYILEIFHYTHIAQYILEIFHRTPTTKYIYPV